MVGLLEPAAKVIGSSCALLRVACNVVRVAARFGYTLEESFESRGRVRRCRECGRAIRSSLEIGNVRGKLLDSGGKSG